MSDNNNRNFALIEGTWTNELGSTLRLECTDTTDPCNIAGAYQTKVGNAVEWNKLSGRATILENGEVQVGFSVTWTNVRPGKKPSITSFVGVVRPSELPTFGPAMYLTWSLVRQTKENTLWDNTMTKTNTFYKDGYVAPVAQDFNGAKLQKALATEALGRYFIERRLTDTTMNVLKREILEGGPHGTLVLAEEQSKPQARFDTRTWSSKPAGNLYFSLLIRSSKDEILSKVLPASAVAVVRACEKEGVQAFVKWPNDVWVSDKKLSGMIARAENVIETFAPKYAINLGVGININEDMSQNEKLKDLAISVSQAAGKPVEREIFLANYLNELEGLLLLDRSEVIRAYAKHSRFQPGDTIKIFPRGVEHPEEAKPAKVVGFNEWFQLIVDGYPTSDATNTALMEEEVSVRL